MNIFSFNRGGKKAGAGSARINTGPYLDQISQGYHGNFKSVEAHKKLLIQPVQIPNLDHCRVNSEFVSVNKKHSEPFVAPDGTVTKALRRTIQNSLPAIRKAYIRHMNQEATYKREQHMEQLSLMSRNAEEEEAYDREDGYGEPEEEGGVFVEESLQSLMGYIPSNEEGSEENVYGTSARKVQHRNKKTGVKVKIGAASFRQKRRKKKKKQTNNNPKGYIL